MKPLYYLITLSGAVALTGCVSAVIAQTGKKELRFPRSREQIVSAYGEPVLSGIAIPGLSRRETVRWEIYEYRGLMRDDGFANSAATAGGVTLGVSEAISLPSVALNRVGSASTTHYFLAEYQRGGKVHPFSKLSGTEYQDYKTRSNGSKAMSE